jgi:hypothetical protein
MEKPVLVVSLLLIALSVIEICWLVFPLGKTCPQTVCLQKPCKLCTEKVCPERCEKVSYSDPELLFVDDAAVWNSSLPSKTVIRLFIDSNGSVEAVIFENAFMHAGLHSELVIKQFLLQVRDLFRPFGLGLQCPRRNPDASSACPVTVKWIAVASLCYESRKFEDTAFSGIQLFQGGRIHCPELYDFYKFLKYHKVIF